LNELPKKGDIVGIDTECITLNNRSVLRLSKASFNYLFSIGRISIIRENDDVPFVDDYIETHEIVSDYLTRFSGLQVRIGNFLTYSDW
jgi:chloramphenicol 3-O-phosphotransferase